MTRARTVLVGLLLTATAVAQDESAPPLEVQVDRIFQNCAKSGGPGAVVLVARGDDVLLQRAYGLADLERDVPLSVDSVFDIASTSKQFTAACVLLLANEGKLALGDAVQKHLPELPTCCEKVTVRHLLLHTSGLPDYIELLLAAGEQVEDRTDADEAFAALRKIEALRFPPGSQWAYSNSNYFLLSEIVERTAKQSLAEFARERIFVPLGMSNTHVHDDCTALVKHRALSYSRGRRGEWVWNYSGWQQTGDGAVLTTVGDLLKWSRNFTTGTVGGDKLLAAMSQPGSLDDGTAIEYGMGLMFLDARPPRLVAHGGAWAGYRAECMRVPTADLTVVCLCNRGDQNPTALAQQVVRAVLDR
ncbi:MAG: serine hydrolase domain-containing protein [Planctomycetota bacterium]